MSDERLHKPELERMAPDRSFANALGAAGSMSDPDDPNADGADEAAGGFVAEGVRAAYEVIDGYLRQGQRVAQSLGMPAYGSVSAGDMSDLSSRWMQASTELMSIWFEFLGSLAENMAFAGPVAGAADEESGQPGGARAPSKPVKVLYDIKSSELSAQPQYEFHPGRDTTELATHGLRSLVPGAKPIGVEFESQSMDCVMVKISVKKGQEPGLYSGALLDAHTGESVGSLSLRLR